TPPPQGIVSVRPGHSCQENAQFTDTTVPDGAWVKVGTPLWLDIVASVTGFCDYKSWSYAPPPHCQFWWTETRYLDEADVTTILPDASQQYNVVYAAWHTQSLDTRGTPSSIATTPSQTGNQNKGYLQIQLQRFCISDVL